MARSPVHEKGNAWLTFCQVVMYPTSFAARPEADPRAAEHPDRGRLPAGRQSHLAPRPAVRLGRGAQGGPDPAVHGQGVAVEGAGAGQGPGRLRPDPGRADRRGGRPGQPGTGHQDAAAGPDGADLPGGHGHPGSGLLADEAPAGHRCAGAVRRLPGHPGRALGLESGLRVLPRGPQVPSAAAQGRLDGLRRADRPDRIALPAGRRPVDPRRLAADHDGGPGHGRRDPRRDTAGGVLRPEEGRAAGQTGRRRAPEPAPSRVAADASPVDGAGTS